MKFSSRLAAGMLAAAGTAHAAISLDISSPESIKQAASTIAYGMVKYYTGNNTGDVPGNLPSPYYWWEAGAFFGALIDYWYYTGDTTYNDITTQAMLWQVGPTNDYMPPNQTKTEGNDDQGFWAMAAMSAAELNFPNPPADQPQWLALAQGVFNDYAGRWDTSTCGGGLRWQIFTFNNGYNYKNSISNGCFFSIGARLGAYTGNQTYLDWAEKVFDWVAGIGLMDSSYQFFDGTDDTANCTSIDQIQWTYNAGIYLLGAATMWNVTTGAQQTKWYNVAQGIMNASSVFFSTNPANVMMEQACESTGKCDTDQQSFKGYLSRWMAAATKVAPFIEEWAMPRLQASAQAAALTCTAGADGNQCGLEWTKQANDGNLGVGEQLAALQVVQANLITSVPGPLTNSTGGTSIGNPSAGGSTSSDPIVFNAITMGDKAGAGILTTLVVVSMFGGAWWMAATSK